ncbi:MAG: type II toxin-antitoxin system Phd/YefM family antitoxin [Candidatus Omnitrophica bacterium]|nr:type II toxin-antitoxin system Phd/YefM family antitoxin [Candidatus Omnitrophota bacterium]
MLIPPIMPVTKVRRNLLELVKNAKNMGQEIIVTTDGEPAAIIIGYKEWESLMETLDVMSDPNLMRQIRESAEYFKRGGKGIPMEEIDWGEE